eukprot:scaffold1540_cov194-Alexandrium_tamarense.AAC.32
MWEEVSRVSGLPSFRERRRRVDLTITDDLHLAKLRADNLTQEIQTLAQTKSADRAELDDVNLRLTEATMLVTRVQLEVEDEREQNSVLCTTVTTLEDENKELAGDNARLEKHLQKLTDSIAKKDDQMTIFQQEVSRLKEAETSSTRSYSV